MIFKDEKFNKKMKQSSIQRRESVKTTGRDSYHQQMTTPSSTTRSNLSSRAKEAEGALERIKRMINQQAQQDHQEDEKLSALSQQSAREQQFMESSKEKDHLKLELNFEDKNQAEVFQSPEYYFFMADRELLEDQLKYITAKYEEIEPQFKEAEQRLERMEFTEKERDQLISEKYYLLSELKKLSNHNYEGELKRLANKRQGADGNLLQSSMDTTFSTMQFQSATSNLVGPIGTNSELQKEYASLKKQLETTEQMLAEAKFKNTKLMLQLEEKTDQYNAMLKTFKQNEKEVNEKSSVLKHLRLQLDRMHAKSSAEIKKLKKQLELTQKSKKLPSSLNVSMVKNSGRAVSNDPGNTSIHLTPETKTQTYSTFRSSEGTSGRGGVGDVVDKSATMMEELNQRLESIQAQQGVVKVQRYGGLVNVGPKSEREEGEKKKSGGTQSAKKGGFFSWIGKKS